MGWGLEDGIWPMENPNSAKTRLMGPATPEIIVAP
jgi:hypothetical protein